MADEEQTSSEASVTPNSDQPVKGTPPATVSATPTGKQPGSLSLEEALAKIAELERSYSNKDEEAKRHYKKLSAYEEAEKKAQEAALSEVEKANKRAAEAEQRIQQYKQQLISTQVKLAAQSKGIIDPDLAALAIHSSLEYDDDGMPNNLDKALDTLIKNKPYLAPKPAAPAEEKTPEPETPAQTAAPRQQPAIPAMNPGRSTLTAPNKLPPGTIPTLSDVFKRPQ